MKRLLWNIAADQRYAMSIPETSSLEEFHRFVGELLQSAPGMDLSPEAAWSMWQEREETLAAIREGLADIEAGRTISIEEFKREFSLKHGIELQ